MSTLYSNNFDAETVGNLPANWSSLRGDWVVSTTGAVSSPNSLRSTGGADDTVLYTGQQVADGVVSITQKYPGNTAYHGLLFRMDALAQNGYLVGYTPTTKNVGFFKKVGDVFTALTAITISAPTYNTGDNWSIEADFSGPNIDVRVWNITQGETRPSAASASISDTTKLTAGYTGVRLGSANATQNGFDDFVLTDGNGGGLIIPRTDANIFYSPYTWADDGTSINANSTGSYFKTRFTGTSFKLKTVALSGLTAYPVVRAYIDNLPAIDIQLTPGQTSLAFASGSLAAGTHDIRVVLKAADETSGGYWNLTNALKVTGIEIDVGATLSAPTLRSKRMLFFGDSITAGVRVNGTTPVYPTGMDGTLSVVPLIAEALDAEYGQVGYGAQGFTQAGNGGVPAFNTAYAFYSNGVSRLVGGQFDPPPDYVPCMHGTNGGPTQANVATAIANLRAAAPNSRIFMIVPPGGFRRTAITAATNAAITAGDTKLSLIDAGSGSYQAGLNGVNGVVVIGAPNEQSADQVHPWARTNARVGAEYVRQMQHILEPRRFTVVAN